MRKNDLKNGMVVEFRDGERGIVINNNILSKETFLELTDINDDLEEIDGETKCDIIKIFETTKTFVLNDMSTGEEMILIWERRQKIDWTKVPNGTIIRVRDYKEQNWNMVELLAYIGEDMEFPFIARGTRNRRFSEKWRYATIDNPKQEWLK